ncbi:MAG: tRNA pseudouridine(13) synthase TruD [Sulfurovum sp.]|nr:tRNA pseudouridine(13) synthase TruD [Sulfurovum sp.]
MPLSHRNEFIFNPSPRDFTVEEIPLYEFSSEGEHLILKVRKKELTTWEMLEIFSSHLGIRRRDIGYAGLKDKHAMTIQYISIMAIHQDKLGEFAHPQIKILDTIRHNNKIRIGHLKGNLFHLRFKKVLGVQKDMLDSVLKWIKQNGVPNYFGYQRFGNYGDNWEEGQRIISGELRMRDRKSREFLISAYQSYLFNNWLSKRIELCRLLEEFSESQTEQLLELPKDTLKDIKKQKGFFKIIEGDLLMHYPHGRIFYAQNHLEESERFEQKDISPTGLLSGKKVKLSMGNAREIEQQFDTVTFENGSRRYAWIFPKDIKSKYLPERAHYELEFFLPKGCYATNVVEILRGYRA